MVLVPSRKYSAEVFSQSTYNFIEYIIHLLERVKRCYICVDVK